MHCGSKNLRGAKAFFTDSGRLLHFLVEAQALEIIMVVFTVFILCHIVTVARWREASTTIHSCCNLPGAKAVESTPCLEDAAAASSDIVPW